MIYTTLRYINRKKSIWIQRRFSSVPATILLLMLKDEAYVHMLQTSLVIQASLVAQLVKNPPAMQETMVQFLGQEVSLEKGSTTHSSILGLLWWPIQ